MVAMPCQSSAYVATETVLNALRANMVHIYLAEGEMRADHPEIYESNRGLAAEADACVGPWESNRFALHKAMQCEMPREVALVSVMKSSPEIVKEREESGDLPLHVAARANPGLSVIRALVYAYPQALHMRNGDGDLPLHVAIMSDASEEVIRYLLRHNLSSASETDAIGNLPLHSLLWMRYSSSLINEVLEAFPEAVRAKGFNGQLPLHASIRHSPWSSNTILDCFPQAVYETDDDGCLPYDTEPLPRLKVQ